jgi:hypothetical protein
MPTPEPAGDLTICQARHRIGRKQKHEGQSEDAPDRVRQKQNHAYQLHGLAAAHAAELADRQRQNLAIRNNCSYPGRLQDT